ncbi:2-dehydro-3-deoxygluconokinase [Labilibaculum manganireducens]|uniref:2-dehydro-3-deoxygluconokinase n=1 Tax=Labilibaculum manganireducens TaxID=1940525 RepID=A0A2N3HX89_9BACT|nr:sugar kinase [Labilibaculum manganireducens]PKQ62669.1 2-dehydro-3-deoxygluconokinase [Labilibaculum manganireducens]
MNKKVITFGEIMLRLATPDYKRFLQSNTFNATYGGGEVNVSVSLANFGIPTAYVTRLPNNDVGKSCKSILNKFGVDTRYIVFGGERLGIYFLETGAVARGSKVVYDRANSAFTGFTKGMIDWNDIFQDACWFHWTGITPAISSGATELLIEALTKANEMGISVSCDVNYRSKLWKENNKVEEVMPALIAKTNVLIGNEFDAGKVLGIQTNLSADAEYSNETFGTVSKLLMEKYPRLEKIITTRRGTISANHNSWMGIMFDGNQVSESSTYQMTHIVDRVGGGDALMAGLIYGFLTYPNNPQKTIDFAVASSFLKHTISGDANDVSVEEVEQLMKGDLGGKIDW